MPTTPPDRRVQRSRQLLQSALLSLMAEQPFAKITVQAILDRANVGRTTFYGHFQSKEDLFLSLHADVISSISRSFVPASDTWPAALAPELLGFLETVYQNRTMYDLVTRGNRANEVLRLIQERVAADLAARLATRFPEADSRVPFVVLAQHLAGALVGVVTWWLAQRTPYSPQEIARMLHELNQATLRAALGR